MIILMLLLLLTFCCLVFTLGVLYYSPGLLPYSFLDFANNIIHNTKLSQDITFIVLCLLVALCIFFLIVIFTTKKRRIARRRKKLIKLFDQYGAKYGAQDKEINF